MMKIKVLEGMLVRYHKVGDDQPSIWFLHGFADSGLAYQEAFDSVLTTHFNLYIVDLPGFGASPINPNCLSIRKQADLLVKVILQETESAATKINIVAHSLSALIGTWICQSLGNQVNYYISVEGNLTEADSYFSSKPLDYETATEFVESFEREVLERAKSEVRYRRYYSSFRFANPEGMRNWSLTSQEYVKNSQCGFEFKDLLCNKIYIWGDLDTPKQTQTFIQQHHIPNQRYEGVGHWHMIENTDVFYRDVDSILKNNAAQL